MKVTEFAVKVGTTPDTVRYYSRVSLLKPGKDHNGYKRFSSRDVARMKFILNARHLGFSVADIKNILSEADKGNPACPLVREIIHTRLQETQKQFADMLLVRAKMTQAVEQWQNMEDKAPTSEMICHLIDSIFPDNGTGDAI